MRKALGTKENLFVTELDVTNEDQVNAAVRTAVHRFERIDVLVNNAGYGQLGVFEETTPVAGSRPVRHECVRSDRGDASGAADHAELADRSHLQHLCIAGLKGFFGGAIYNSSKFAVEGFSQSIAEELAPLGTT